MVKVVVDPQPLLPWIHLRHTVVASGQVDHLACFCKWDETAKP